MGLAERALPPVDGTMEPIAGIQLRAPLRPIYTKPLTAEKNPEFHGRGEEEEEEISTTPTAAEARIPESLRCPPAPRKRKPSLKCGGDRARVFFNPPDLETVFIRHV